MKTILYITSFLPYDTPFAGSKTSHRILRSLCKNYSVDLLTFSTQVEKEYLSNFQSFCSEEENINLIDVIPVDNFVRVFNSLFFFLMPALLVARFSFLYLFNMTTVFTN